MEKKICSKCGIEKEVCEFGLNNSAKDKLRTSCKKCRKDEGRLYRELNIEKRKSTIKNWKDKNPNYNQSYYINNKEKCNLRNKNWYELNKEKCRDDNKKWTEKNIDKVRKYHNDKIKRQRKTDPLKQLIFNTRTRIYSVLKNKTKKTFDIVGCSPEFLKEHIEKQFTDGMCWENQGKYGWHIDHVIPLSSAKTEKEIYELCHYTNLQPLWAGDNLKKGAKILS